MIDVVMPQMGESIAEGTVTRWLKKPGDAVERDEPLLEISTDKVDAEIPSPASGTLREIVVQEGATVAIQTVLARIGTPDDKAATPVPTPPSEAEPAEAPGVEPEPATHPAESEPTAATPAHPAEPPKQQLTESGPQASAPEEEAAAEDDTLRRTRSSPLVRRIAAENRVDISQLRGTGLGGRVTKQDILDHIKNRLREEGPAPEASAPAGQAPAPLTAAPAAPPPVAPAVVAGPRDHVVAMTPIRKRTALHMAASRRIAAHATTLFEIDMTRVERLRAAHRRPYQDRGVPLTFLPFILKATVDALRTHPVLNASLDGENIVYHRDIHIGIAVALEKGLIVPVIRNAQDKSVFGLAEAVVDLAERARTKRLKVEEVQGGTFSVTNPGVFGSLFGTPIIHQPQVGILAVGTIEKRPVVREEAIAVRSMAYFALSFDHRLVDGADADRFMANLKKGLQEFDESAL